MNKTLNENVIAVILTNILLAVIINAGLVSAFARSCLMPALIPFAGATYYRDAYFQASLVNLPLVVSLNLLLQAVCVTGAARALSPRLARNQNFIGLLWYKTFLHGIPLLLLIFVGEYLSSFTRGPIVLLPVVLWPAYLYVTSLLLGRNYLRARSIRINRKCPQCLYLLRVEHENRCSECGWQGSHWPKIDEWAWVSMSMRFLGRLAFVLGLAMLTLAVIACGTCLLEIATLELRPSTGAR